MHRMNAPASPNSVPEGELPPALPDMSEHVEGRPGPTVGAVGPPGQAIRLTDALAMSLRNVETVQANLSVRTATVARFEALKAFVPLVNLPMLEVGLSRLTGPLAGQTVIFPDSLAARRSWRARPAGRGAHRFNIFLPLDPSGQITALPIAEEGIRGKELMSS